MRTPRLALSTLTNDPRAPAPVPDDTAGDTGGGGAGEQGTGAAAAGDGQDTDTAAATDTTAAAKDTKTAGSVEDLPEWAQKVIRQTRDEAAANRTAKTAAEKAQQQTLDNIAKALGLKEDGKLTADQLAEKLNASDGKAKSALTENAVLRAATKAGADAEALLDSRSFLAKLTDLDPTAGDFADKVEHAVKAACKDNPKLKTVRAAGASGAEFTGGSGDEGQITETQLKSMTPDQIAEALNKGRLAHLL